jgi:hypothetical protein
MSLKLIPTINGRILGKLGWRLVRVRPRRREVAQLSRAAAHCAIEDVDDVRFRTSDWVYSVPVERLVGRPIFGYGPQSWHPLVAASAELLEDMDLPYELSILRRFYETFTPRTVAEAYRLDDPGPLTEVPAATLFEPWRLAPPPLDDPTTSTYAAGSPLFGPLTRAAGEAQWRRLRGRVKSMLAFGYQPDLFPQGRIRVTVLKSGHEKRYLVGHGQHRAAVLAAMGHERIDVGIHVANPPVADEAEASTWPHVRSGFLSTEQARAMLRRYFAPPASDPALQIGAAARREVPSGATAGP